MQVRLKHAASDVRAVGKSQTVWMAYDARLFCCNAKDDDGDDDNDEADGDNEHETRRPPIGTAM